jgi:hypothetical protein
VGLRELVVAAAALAAGLRLTSLAGVRTPALAVVEELVLQLQLALALVRVPAAASAATPVLAGVLRAASALALERASVPVPVELALEQARVRARESAGAPVSMGAPRLASALESESELAPVQPVAVLVGAVPRSPRLEASLRVSLATADWYLPPLPDYRKLPTATPGFPSAER